MPCVAPSTPGRSCFPARRVEHLQSTNNRWRHTVMPSCTQSLHLQWCQCSESHQALQLSPHPTTLEYNNTLPIAPHVRGRGRPTLAARPRSPRRSRCQQSHTVPVVLYQLVHVVMPVSSTHCDVQLSGRRGLNSFTAHDREAPIQLRAAPIRNTNNAGHTPLQHLKLDITHRHLHRTTFCNLKHAHQP